MRLFLFFIFISTVGFAQTAEKKILFRGDSIWYASQKQFLFSSTDKGEKWDTVFGKRDSVEIVFFDGELDTASNVFISDQHTVFVFGWDGTMLYQTILYCSSDCGKTWRKSKLNSRNGQVGVRYLHRISSQQFFIYLRNGYYAISQDAGKTWEQKCMVTDKYGCFDNQVSYGTKGKMYIRYSRSRNCSKWEKLYSTDGGITWKS